MVNGDTAKTVNSHIRGFLCKSWSYWGLHMFVCNPPSGYAAYENTGNGSGKAAAG